MSGFHSPAASPEGSAVKATGATDGHVLTADGANAAAWEAIPAATPEGTAVKATGVTDGYVLTADGANAAAWEAIPASGMVLRASSDTPVPTTSTSVVELITITGLSIPVTSRVRIEIGTSKDALAADSVTFGLTINSTVVRTALGGSSTTNQVEDGFMLFEIMPRSAAAPNGLLITRSSRVTASGAAALAPDFQPGTAPMPVAEITSLKILAANNNSNNNATVEWYRVWELPV